MGGGGGMNPFQNTPAFCRVTATLTPTSDSDIKIEVWMPKENWNGKLVGIGNGVWAGTISHSAMAEPIAKGYATVATDTGHVGTGMDAKWAVGHKEKLVDFGYRAVHEMTVKAKEILAVYYGKKEDKAFWVSCSTGGRQGLMAAYRYPDDFDGVSSMAPANPMVGLMISSLWSGYVSLRDDAHKLTPAQLMLSNKAYTEKCDEVDGVKDGLVSWPEMCSYDPGVIQCKDGAQEGCLTAPQLEALKDIYGGVKNPRTGELVFSGFTPEANRCLACGQAVRNPLQVQPHTSVMWYSITLPGISSLLIMIKTLPYLIRQGVRYWMCRRTDFLSFSIKEANFCSHTVGQMALSLRQIQ